MRQAPPGKNGDGLDLDFEGYKFRGQGLGNKVKG